MSLELDTGNSKYDSSAFAVDVDAAIEEIRRVALMEKGLAEQKQVIDPVLRPDMTITQALFQVCLALSMRELLADGFLPALNGVLNKTRDMLLAKNAAYGDSALSPVRIFSRVSLKEQILVRLDDKASRLMRGSNAGEDVAADMLGYFVLMFIAEKRDRLQLATQVLSQ